LAIIRLEGLSLFGHHGARPFEKEAGQRIDVDLELLSLDDRAERTDRLADAVDYDQLNRTVREVVEGQSFHLLEALGAAVAEAVLRRFPVRRVHVRLAKQNLGWTTGGRAVIEIVRERPARECAALQRRRAAGGRGPAKAAPKAPQPVKPPARKSSARSAARARR
jgi:dihydroneopterin aldolase